MAPAQRIVIGRSAGAFLVAAGAGAIALVAPPAALLVLALLGGFAFLRAQTMPRIDFAALAGPVFAALIAGALAGPAVGMGILFVWRLWADARWSIGEAKRLALVAGRPDEARQASLGHAWLTPAFGLAMIAYTSPHIVVGLPLDLPHLPNWAPFVAGALAGGFVFDWALRRAADWRLGELAPTPTAHLAAHHLIFVLAYGLTLDISAGLVALAAWRLAHAAPVARLVQANFTAVP